MTKIKPKAAAFAAPLLKTRGCFHLFKEAYFFQNFSKCLLFKHIPFPHLCLCICANVHFFFFTDLDMHLSIFGEFQNMTSNTGFLHALFTTRTAKLTHSDIKNESQS